MHRRRRRREPTWWSKLRDGALLAVLPLVAFALFGTVALSDGLLGNSNNPAPSSGDTGGLGVNSELASVSPQGETADIAPLVTLPFFDASTAFTVDPLVDVSMDSPTEILAALENLGALVFGESGS